MRETSHEILISGYERVTVLGAASERQAIAAALLAVDGGDLEVDGEVDGGWDKDNQEIDGTFSEHVAEVSNDPSMRIVRLTEK